jgi:hypothetical protein
MDASKKEAKKPKITTADEKSAVKTLSAEDVVTPATAAIAAIAAHEAKAPKAPKKVVEPVKASELKNIAKVEMTTDAWDGYFKGKVFPSEVDGLHLVEFAKRSGNTGFYMRCMQYSLVTFKGNDLTLAKMLMEKYAA